MKDDSNAFLFLAGLLLLVGIVFITTLCTPGDPGPYPAVDPYEHEYDAEEIWP